MRPRRELLLDVATAVVVVCVLVVTAVIVRRDVFGAPGNRSTRASTPVDVKNWERLSQQGHRVGPANARVTIVEFSDFQCPFCRRYALDAVPAIRRQYPADVAFVFRNWPLPVHQHSYDAAKSAECAGAQGRFDAYHDALFAQQGMIGTKPYAEFAREAGVRDSQVFAACLAKPGKVPSIETDMADAQAVGGHGTPTIVVNGWYLRAAPDSARLDSLIRAELARAGKRN